MLMDVQCSATTQVTVNLRYDDNRNETYTIGKGDIVEISYNRNGLRSTIEGKVVRVSCVGTDPKGWFIMIDGSNDFESEKVRICPTSILACEIIQSASEIKYIATPRGRKSTIAALRVIKGRLEYSQNGYEWSPILINASNVVYGGTCPNPDDENNVTQDPSCDSSCTCGCHSSDMIEDEDVI